ncbi:galactose oxidase [Imleria badia]|nr:galactose oxidase [Imleria badia]
MHSISDLTTFCRKTSGDVPAKLVGASTTVVGSKMYLFGGRLVTERRMVSDLYVFDLDTFTWEKITPFQEDDVPEPRYFHSAETWNNHLIIFGGMGNAPNSSNTEDLCVLNDIRFLDLLTMHWLPASSTNGLSPDAPADALVPKPRYAHLSSVTADRLFIIGGQDLSNVWLDDVYVYDLLGKAWVQRRNFPHHCGTYRSVAVSANLRVRLPQEESRATDNTAILGSPGTRFRSDKASPSYQEFTPTESLVHLPYSASPTDDFPNDIYLYSNYNFTDVKRELEVFSPLPDTDFTITDRSTAMNGTSFPPGLRFPSGAVLGTHFLIAGTYLAHTYQSYSIWALDLLTMTWSRIDPGNSVASGSWFRTCLWAEANKFVVFGNRNGNLVEDYNRRLLSWDHVAVIDLESFGIYQPPSLRLDVPMQEFGLSALEEGVLTDFEVVCDDGRRIKCSRKILEDRWPWFKDQRVKFLERAHQAIEILPSSSMDVGLPDLPGAPDSSEPRPDPRLTPRAFHLSEPYPITLALLQYFYSLALITPLQHAPAVLSQLLILSNTYHITHLEALVKHAMHRALSNSTSVGVYEVATLCSCRSLQIRALKTVMSYSQKRTGRSRSDSKGGSGGNRNPDPGDSDHQGRGSDETLGSSARTRGASDARLPAVDQQNSGTNRAQVAKITVPTRDGVSYQSPAAASVASSQINGHSHKATLSSSTLTPPPSWAMSNHSRPFSIVSAHTDFELCAVAELLSPAVSHARSIAEEQEAIGVALDDGLDDYIDASIKRCDQRKRKASTTPHLLLECEEPFSPPHPSYSPASCSFTPSESESESLPEDNQWHSHAPSAFPIYHLPRRNRARKQSSAGVSTSDSDTPSLSSSTTSVSSSHSRSYSPLRSPTILKTPVDHVSPSHTLAIIEERSTGHRVPIDRHASQGSGSMVFAPMELSFVQDLGQPPRIMENRTKNRNIENLRVNVPPLSVPFPILTHSPSPTVDLSPSVITNRTVMPGSRSGLKSLTRIISPVSKTSRSFEFSSESSSSPTMSVSTSKSSKVDAKEARTRKAEAKRMKKAEDKAKVERLAEELKERQRRKALAPDKGSVRSNGSGGRPREIAMYGGLEGVM